MPALATNACRTQLCAGALSALVLLAAAQVRADDTAARPMTDVDSPRGWGLTLAARVEHGNQRSFRQLEPTTGETLTYSARVYGGVGVALGLERPVTQVTSWCLRADYFRSLFFTSAARRLGRPVDTTAQRLSALTGLSVRPASAPLGLGAELLIGASAMRFDYDLPSPRDDDDRAMELATGDYLLLNVGLGGRMQLFDELAWVLRGSYLHGLHTGSFGAREARGQPVGFDAQTAFELRVLPWLDLSAQGGLTLLALRLQPTAARPADGPAEVSDLYLTFGLGTKVYF